MPPSPITGAAVPKDAGVERLNQLLTGLLQTVMLYPLHSGTCRVIAVAVQQQFGAFWEHISKVDSTRKANV